MTENKKAAAVVAKKKHRGRSAEGSVRVLGQTAAVAGVSGMLLLALKAMVLVSPAVLPDSDGLDALGRPNAVTETTQTVEPPVTFSPAANLAQDRDRGFVGSSERTSGAPERDAGTTSPGGGDDDGSDNEVETPGGTDNENENPGGENPGGGATNPPGGGTNPPGGGGGGNDNDDDGGAVGGVVDTVTDTVDKVAPGTGGTVNKTLKPVTDTVEKVAEPVTKVVPVEKVTKPVEKAVEPVTDTVEKVAKPVTKPVTDVVGGVLGSKGGGLLG